MLESHLNASFKRILGEIPKEIPGRVCERTIFVLITEKPLEEFLQQKLEEPLEIYLKTSLMKLLMEPLRSFPEKKSFKCSKCNPFFMDSMEKRCVRKMFWRNLLSNHWQHLFRKNFGKYPGVISEEGTSFNHLTHWEGSNFSKVWQPHPQISEVPCKSVPLLGE